MSGATSPEAETIIRQTAEINRLMDQSAGRIERLQRQLDSTYAAQTRFTQAQNSINSALERGRISQDRANELLDLARQKYQAAGQAVTGFASANDNAARGSRNLGGLIGQAGFQVQDFAVQVASGQSALTAFVQQGSQLAGAFGSMGAIVGAGLAIAGVIIQLSGAKTATEALNEAIERQKNLYETTSDAAERYRRGLQTEQDNVVQLTTYYSTLSTEMRGVERLRLQLARADLLTAQQTRVREATSRLGGLADAGAMAPGMPFAESAMAGIGGPGNLAPGLREAAEAVARFREQGNFTQETISALILRLTDLAAANVGSSRAIIAQRDALMEAAPQLLASQRALEQNAAANAALDGNARGAAAALGAVGAAAAAQLMPLRDLLRDLDKVNVELAAMRRGGLEGLEQARRAQTIMERAGRDLDQEVQQRVARGASQADARRQALEDNPMTDRIAEASRLVGAQRQVEEGERRLREEERKREQDARRAASQAERDRNAEARLTERVRRERDQLIASLDQEAAANLRLEESLRRIADARQRNLLSEEQEQTLRAEAIRRRDEEIRRLYDKSDLDAEQVKRITGLTSDLGTVFRDTFSDAVREGKSFSEVLQNLEQRLLRLGDKYLLEPLLQNLAQLATQQLGGGAGGGGGFLGQLLGSGFTAQAAGNGLAKGAELIATAAVAHTGGIIGDPSLPTRPVPASVFLDAPRYHSGGYAGRMPFANDEVPAVLRRGELVLTKEQQRAANAAPSMTVNNYIATPAVAEFRRSGGQVSADIARAVSRGARNR